MPRFMDIHDGFVGVTREELAAAHAQDERIQDEEGVRFDQAWLDQAVGKVFCLSSAPSKEAVMRVHERAGHPTTEIYELTVQLG